MFDTKDIHPLAMELGRLFVSDGLELALVGGSVRDLFLKREDSDLDFTTNARPDHVYKLLSNWCDDVWDIGKDFGTIGGNKYFEGQAVQIEVTTYRTDEYDSESRKPLVKYGDTLEADLSRRDFTVNAIALRVPELELVDPFNGLTDLNAKVLRTPIDPTKSFDDDPLRMLRAVRFVASLGFRIDGETAAAILQMRDRLEIVSKERIRDEFVKLILSDNPVVGLEALVESGMNNYVLPELEDLKMAIDKNHHHKDVYAHTLKVLENAIQYEYRLAEAGEADEAGQKVKPNLILRLAALLHDIGKPQTRRFESDGQVTFRGHDVVGAKITKRRLKELRFDKSVVSSVATLVALHMRFYGYTNQGWADSAVRRFVTDAGDLLEELLILTRSDVTTRNRRKAQILEFACDDLENRIQELREQEELDAIRPDLNGHDIMEILGLKPGPQDGPKIGKAYSYMLEYRMTHGPVERAEAVEVLKKWASDELAVASDLRADDDETKEEV
jgi:poly(A) polymerase